VDKAKKDLEKKKERFNTQYVEYVCKRTFKSKYDEY